MQEIESLASSILRLGFPVVVSLILLFKVEVRMAKLEEKMGELNNSILGKDGILDKVEDVIKVLDRQR